MEVSIIGTSLISIVNDLRGFSQMGWVVTGYLITYTGLLIIWAKISDIYGRKPAMIISMLIFTVFSGGCGAAHTMIQLIVCRVFQGVGAAGTVSLALVAAYEMVPKDKYPLQAALIGSAIALGSLVGPLIGGGVSEHSTWRWVFLINVPVGVVSAALLYISVPSNFPYHGRPVLPHPITNSLSRLDISGASLLLGATVLLVTVLLEAGIEFAWKSGTAIALIILSGILFVAFMLNEKAMSKEKRTQEPKPKSRNKNANESHRMSFLSGVPYNIIVIDIPQRFQAIDSISPFTSGLRLIPFNFSISLSSILVNIIAKRRIPPIILLFIGSIIQLLGMSLFSTLPENGTLPNTIYGWEVLTGFGMGWVMGICLLLPPAVVEGRDLAISSGCLLQFRVLGGALGLAISTTIMNNYLTSHLTPLLGAEQLSLLLQSTRWCRFWLWG
ncbi:major facilitator superfamily transporter protein [Rutstroemia sp. NJR-2017a BBW]|nr:major facilitator superfamily transporter protein [Rutstroemia sp. NJR-2017a BBW]